MPLGIDQARVGGDFSGKDHQMTVYALLPAGEVSSRTCPSRHVVAQDGTKVRRAAYPVACAP